MENKEVKEKRNGYSLKLKLEKVDEVLVWNFDDGKHNLMLPVEKGKNVEEVLNDFLKIISLYYEKRKASFKRETNKETRNENEENVKKVGLDDIEDLSI